MSENGINCVKYASRGTKPECPLESIEDSKLEIKAGMFMIIKALFESRQPSI
jgi:hypothetical protein